MRDILGKISFLKRVYFIVASLTIQSSIGQSRDTINGNYQGSTGFLGILMLHILQDYLPITGLNAYRASIVLLHRCHCFSPSRLSRSACSRVLMS